MSKFLIQGGFILSMNSALGDISAGDILIEDDLITEVGRGIDAPDAEIIDARQMILLPGLVDAHLHTWQTGVRGIAGDWALANYSAHMHHNLAAYFAPEDLYLANLLGGLNHLNCGITALFDFCHNNRTPDHSDRAIDGLEESGIRALFGHGVARTAGDQSDVPLSQRPHSPEEIKRLRCNRLHDDGARIRMAMAIRGPSASTYEMTVHDLRLAREYDLVTSCHIGAVFKPEVPDGLRRLSKDGLLGPSFNAVHANQFSDEELKILIDNGCTVTACPEVEMQMGHGKPVVGRMLKLGGAPSLGIDVESNICSDMFIMIRMALQFARAMENQEILDTRKAPENISILTRKGLEWATIEGARALGMEDQIGSLTPGKQADLILIRTDALNLFPVNNPLDAVVYQASFANVDTVFVGGEIVKKDGNLLYPKLREKMDQLAESGRRLLKDGGFVSSQFLS